MGPNVLPLLFVTPASGADLHVGSGREYAVLQDAVDAASPGDRLVVHPGVYDPVVLVRSVELVGVDGAGATTIRASGGVAVRITDGSAVLRGFTFDGLGVERVLEVAAAEVRVEDSVLRAGAASEGGCGELLDSTSLFRRTTIEGCSATEAGGLRVVGGELRLEDVTVTDNVATDGRGGGVFISDATFVSVGGAFLANRVEDSSGGENHGYGGGLYGIGSELTVTGTRFEDNEARSILPEAGIGAALRGFDSEVTVDGSWFRDNVAAESGSAVAVEGSESRLSMVRSRVEDNLVDEPDADANRGGAVLCADGAVCALDRVWFEANTAGDGGAVLSVSDLAVSTSMFCDNEATDDAGAIDVGILESGASVTISGNVFVGNTADDYAGALLGCAGPIRVVNNHFVANEADQGGAVYTSSVAGQGPGFALVSNLYVGNDADIDEAAVDFNGVDVAGSYGWFFDNEDDHLFGANDISNVFDTNPQLGAFLACSQMIVPGNGSGLVDAGDPSILDRDGSRSDVGGFGGPTADLSAFDDRDGDGFASMNDCDDGDPTRSPDGIERCNNVDDDCDGLLDAAELTIDGAWLHPDGDGDGWGDPASPAYACPRSGWVGNPSDCDDQNPGVGAERTFWVDHDGDGLGDPALPIEGCSPGPGTSAEGTDCDDLNPGVGAPRGWTFDGDGDGHGAGPISTDCASPGPGWVADLGDDCDDGNGQTLPGAVEQCNDIDDDCNGAVDDDVVDVDWWPDADLDGYGTGTPVHDCLAPGPAWAAADGDCDDAAPQVNPGEPERCGARDDDCDGLFQTDDPDFDPSSLVSHYPDRDGDGWGDGAGIPVLACDGPPGTAPDGTDCDDAAAAVHPEATDIPQDGIDQDCDGVDAPITDVPPDTDGDGVPDRAETPDGINDAGGVMVASPEPRFGCGCDGTGGAGWTASLLGLGLMIRRTGRKPRR